MLTLVPKLALLCNISINAWKGDVISWTNAPIDLKSSDFKTLY